jgi:N-acetylglucosaminyl-diphospho-decaprenol L-rhamnosyltransferase
VTSSNAEDAAPATGDGVDVSIIIVNYNGGELVEPCIASIHENPPRVPYEIVFVDNASVDGSGERVRDAFPDVVYLPQDDNLGLARAFNVGLRAARGRYVLSLDNDTRVLPDAIQLLVDHLAAHPEAGATGSLLLNPDMTPQRTFRRTPSAVNAVFGRRSLITRLWPSNPISRRYLMEERSDATEPFDVGWVSTAALMVSREALERAGGLDEDFFVYWVDADWCARIRRAGLGIVAVPRSRVIHDENLKRKARAKRSARMIKDFHRGAYLYYRKNHSASGLNPLVPVAWVALNLRARMLIAWDDVVWWFRSDGASPSR